MKGRMIFFSISVIVIFSMMLGLTSSTAQTPRSINAPKVALGEPGLSYRYDKTYGTLQVPYVADPNYLNSPAGLFIDDSDNLYVTEESGFRVLEYDPTPTISLTLGIAGHPAWMFGGDENLFDSPHDVALDNSGNTWVTDGNRVAQFDPSGVYLRQLVDSGDPINPFIDLWGIAFDSQGRMFVSDIYNQRVQIYDISPITPTLVDTIGEIYDPSVGGCLSDNNHFCYPWRIAIDSLDQLYVADKDNGRVQKCTYSSGWSCALFDSGLNQPRGLTVDGNDNVYIADNGRIRKCISGNCNDLVTDTQHFMDLAVDSAGNVYAAASWDVYTVYQYASTGQLIDAEYIGHVGVPYPADLDHYYFPLVNTDAEDNILITEEWGHQLIKLYHDGTPPWSFGEAGVAGWDDEHLNSPMRVATDSSGNIYVPNAWACGVQVISPDGDYIKSIGGPDSCGSGDVQFNATLGVAIDSNGYLYVADSGNQRVQILDISLITPTLVATIGVTGDCQTDNDHLCAPSSVALDTAGNIYIADTGNHRVQKFDSNFDYQMTIGIAGIAGGEFDQLNWLEDVVVDMQGRIFVSDGGNQRVQVFDSTGAYLTTIGGASGTNSSQFYNAGSVAIDSVGNVYVSDNINSRIQKYAPGVPNWKQVNINGFGSPNTILPVLKPFNGQLYAGAGYSCDGAQILRTTDGTTWDPVTTPGEGISVGNAVILSMIEFGGKLYVGTGWNCEGNPPEIWRTTDGTVWTQVMTGTLDDEWNIDAFGVFGDQIYTAISTVNGVTIYRSSTGDVGSWSPVVTGGNGDVDNDLIRDFAVFNDRLYAVGGNTANGAFVWQSTADGSTWTQANTPGFDSTIQSDAQSIAVFNGTLYVGTICQSPVCVGDHSEIWKATNGTDWSLVPTPFANNSYWDVTSLYAFKDALFAVVARPGGNTVWKTFNGTGWQQVNINGWGDSNNEWSLWDNAITAFNNRIYVATNNVANGAEIWRYSYPLYLPLITR